MEDRIVQLENLGIPRENIRIHPHCQDRCSSVTLLQREEQWGINLLGAYVGHSKYVAKHLNNILISLKETVELLLKYPNIQARYFLHKLSLNQQVNYYLRAHFPQHSWPLVEEFKILQLKLICSYHAINFEEQFPLQSQEIWRLYKMAVIPIDMGGMGLRCINAVHCAAFLRRKPMGRI